MMLHVKDAHHNARLGRPSVGLEKQNLDPCKRCDGARTQSKGFCYRAKMPSSQRWKGWAIW